jgi:hypothetical protein
MWTGELYRPPSTLTIIISPANSGTLADSISVASAIHTMFEIVIRTNSAIWRKGLSD